MNLKGIRPSRNYEDRTNFLNVPVAERPVASSLTGRLPPLIPLDQLSPFERTLVTHMGFKPEDILLMRATGARPAQVMQGWNLQP